MSSLLVFGVWWARVALALYGAAVATSIAATSQSPERHKPLFQVTRGLVSAGFLFQFVSLVEMAFALPLGPVSLYHLAASLLVFVVAAFFLAVYRPYSPRAMSLSVLPLMCLLAAAAALGDGRRAGGPAPQAASLAHNPWIYTHILLIFLGYCGLVVAMLSGVAYLVAERGLKAKTGLSGNRRVLPSLEALDLFAYRALLVGFPLLTLGLIIGAYWADSLFGRIEIGDPTVLLALLAWGIYLVLLFARWSAGWRGRRSAYLVLVCFGLALAGWLANGFSTMHTILLR